MRGKFAAKPGQVESCIYPTNQVIVRQRIFEVKLVEKLSLLALQTAHHGSTSPRFALPQPNHGSGAISTDFCNKIGTKRTSGNVRPMSAFGWIVLKNSKIAWLRKSRKCSTLAISVAARLGRTGTSSGHRFCGIRCGPSPRSERDAPAAPRIFNHKRKRTFSTQSARSGHSRTDSYRLFPCPSPTDSIQCHPAKVSPEPLPAALPFPVIYCEYILGMYKLRRLILAVDMWGRVDKKVGKASLARLPVCGCHPHRPSLSRT
jgi:hypothetical protein